MTYISHIADQADVSDWEVSDAKGNRGELELTPQRLRVRTVNGTATAVDYSRSRSVAIRVRRRSQHRRTCGSR